MNKQINLSWNIALSGIGLIVAACGILIQVFSGVAAGNVPIGAFVMLALAGLVFARVWRWTPTLGAAITLFILVGTFIAPGLTKRLSDPAEFGPFIGTVLQLVGLVTALIAGVITTVKYSNARKSLA